MNLKKIAIFSALPIEYKILLRKFKLSKKEILNRGYLTKGFFQNLECIFVLTGLGKACASEAASSVIAEFKPDMLLDTGTCASLIDDLDIGNLVLSLKSYEIGLGLDQFLEGKNFCFSRNSSLNYLSPKLLNHIFSKLNLPLENKLYFPATMACAEFCLSSSAYRKRLAQIFNAQAFCWETAAIFLCAQRKGLPALSLRVVSDQGEENSLTEFKRSIKKVMLILAESVEKLLLSTSLQELWQAWQKIPNKFKRKYL